MYLLITLLIILCLLYLMINRNFLLWVGRWILHRRYKVQMLGNFQFDPRKNYMIIPNHPAIVDPLILVPELHHKKVDICPLVDESFFTNRIIRHILSMFNAIRVPDFRKINYRPIPKVRPELRSSAKRAKALEYSVLALLISNENVLLYPSGHVTTDGTESLGNRQLAYNVISQLPEGVQVVGVRMRGIYGSMFSRKNGRQAPPFLSTLVLGIIIWPFSLFRRRRKVSIYMEDVTEKVQEWSKGTRQEFDKALETWYDADLKEKGLKAEIPT